MHNRFTLLIAIVAALRTGAGLSGKPPAHNFEPADLIVHAGRIWTGDASRPWSESMAARGDRIVAVGTRNDIDSLRGGSTRVLELPGSFATPGLVDAHGHLTSLGETLERVDLRGALSISEVVKRVLERQHDGAGDDW